MGKTNSYQSKSINVHDSFIAGITKQTVFLDEVNNIKDRLVLLYIYSLPRLPLHGYKVGMTICKLGETFWHAIKTRIDAQEYELALDSDLLKTDMKNMELIEKSYFGAYVSMIKMIISKTTISIGKLTRNFQGISKRIKNGSRVISLLTI